MRLRSTLALVAAALILPTAGITEATASAPAPVVQAADGDSDDTDPGTPTEPTEATIGTPDGKAAGFAPLGGPNLNNCRLWSWALGETCFQWVGDVQWIRDKDPNGWTATVHVQTNYGKNRYCKAPAAADGWGYCDYDHREGKCVKWRVYELKGKETRNWSQWSEWYGTEYGSPCGPE